MLLLLAQLAGNLITIGTTPEERTLWQEFRNLTFWSLLAGLAIGINPNGLSIWLLPFQQVNVSMQIQEWLSPDFHRIDFHPFLWALFLLIFLSPFAPKPPKWAALLKVLGFSYLTFVAQRNIAIAAIVSVPLLSEWMNAALHAFKRTNASTPPKPASAFKNFYQHFISIYPKRCRVRQCLSCFSARKSGRELPHRRHCMDEN